MRKPIRILFVCHGNICRSPMAEFVMKDLVEQAGVVEDFVIASAATRDDEIGSDIHPGTRRMLDKHGIAHTPRAARRIRRADAETWDCIVCMDDANVRDIMRQLGPDAAPKVHKLLEFTGSDADVADPWYTGDFATTYRDVDAGCRALLARLLSSSAEG